MKQEIDKNRLVLKEDMQSNEVEERNHRADLAVLRRLRAGALRPDDHIVYVRGYAILGSSAWKIVHESNAAAYIPFELMRRYGEIYDAQEILNEIANSAYAELQKVISVFNTEEEDQDGSDKNQAQHEYAIATANTHVPSIEQMSTLYSRMSGKQDLSRLTPGQVDRLEQGFQQAITDDRRLHRIYVYLDGNELILGAVAPPATLVTLDGQRIFTPDLMGQVVILTFWATWCAPCRDELPLLSRYALQHADEGLRVLGFSLDRPDKLADVRQFAQALHFPIGLLVNSMAPGYGRIWRLPVNFTIDRAERLTDNGWRDKNPSWTPD